MVKTIKPKAAKSPRKSFAEPSHTSGKKTGWAHKKTTASIPSNALQSKASNNKLEEPAFKVPTIKIPACVVWDKYPECTEHLLDFLDIHIDIAIKLFGDSTQAANLEGCSK
jgi:hypothetical protein